MSNANRTELQNLINRTHALESAGLPSAALTAVRARLAQFHTELQSAFRVADQVAFDAVAARLALLEASWVLGRARFSDPGLSTSVRKAEGSLANSVALTVAAIPDANLLALLPAGDEVSYAGRIEQVARAIVHAALAGRIDAGGGGSGSGDGGSGSGDGTLQSVIDDILAHISDTDAALAAAVAAAHAEVAAALQQLAADKAELSAALADTAHAVDVDRAAAASAFADLQAAMAGGAATVATLSQTVAGNTAAVTSEAAARATADLAIAGRIDVLGANVATNSAALLAEQVARADATTALAARMDGLVVSSGAQKVFAQATAPANPSIGDLWLDTSRDNRLMWWNGTAWLDYTDARLPAAVAAITAESLVRTSADQALADQITTLFTHTSDNAAAITSEQTARTTADQALATRIDQFVASTNDAQHVFAGAAPPPSPVAGDLWIDIGHDNILNYWDGAHWVPYADGRVTGAIASIAAETTARTAADGAIADQITALTTTVAGNTSAINTETLARSTADSALSALITTLRADVGGNTAAISQEAITRANATDALSSRIDNVVASTGAPKRVWAQSATPTAYGPGDLWLDTADNNRIKYWDGAAWIDYTDNRITAAIAAITNEQTARTDADSALANALSTLTTTVGANTASISTEQTARVAADNSISAKYAVKVDLNGYVSGFGLISDANNATPTSAFTILADNFLVAKPGVSGGAPVTVFSVLNVGGVAKLALKGDMVADGSITAGKISVGSLSALSANLGTVTTGKIQSASGGVLIDLAADNVAITAGKFSISNGSGGTVPPFQVVGGQVLIDGQSMIQRGLITQMASATAGTNDVLNAPATATCFLTLRAGSTVFINANFIGCYSQTNYSGGFGNTSLDVYAGPSSNSVKVTSAAITVIQTSNTSTTGADTTTTSYTSQSTNGGVFYQYTAGAAGVYKFSSTGAYATAVGIIVAEYNK